MSNRRPIFGAGKKVAYTGTAGSTTVDQSANAVLVYCSTAAYVRIGGDATTADLPVPANALCEIPISANLRTGAPITVSAIQDASNGNLFVMPLAE